MNLSKLRFLPVLTVAMLTAVANGLGGNTKNDVSGLKALYDSHQWFELRDAVRSSHAPVIYRGAVEAVFNKSQLAETHLQTVIAANPTSEDAYIARDLLTSLYMRAGKYKAALLQNEQMLKLKPNQGDTRDLHDILSVLGKYPNQGVVKRVSSKITCRILNGNLLIPLQIGSKKAEYILDTAASMSTISESEARRLNLVIHESRGNAQTANGGQLGVQIAMADDIVVGNIHLSHVAFLVVPDEQPPFSAMAVGRRGIVGLPILLAFRNLHWHPNGTLEIASETYSALNSANLCFQDIGLVAQGKLGLRSIHLVVDTGAIHSQLWPLFERNFPEVAKQGKRESAQMTGMSGSSQYPVIVVPEVKFALGQKLLTLRDAVIFLKQDADLASWYEGDLGMDILTAQEFTIDFRNMLISLK